MYVFASYERIVSFFTLFNIDITIFSAYQQSTLILGFQLFVLLFYLFIFYILYKLIFRIIDWWF